MGADLAAEEHFGPYLVYERLGVGGMATVHRALEQGIEGFERIVALKRLLPHLAEDATFIKSFVREAKLASLLNHNNIVQIFELGRVGTEYFISMEYIDGVDLRQVLRHARRMTGPPPIHVTVGLLLQLCDALDYAHTKADDEGQPLGLVHRDVSPSNVLVTSAGHVKVIDFGIAKAQSQQLRTQTGRVKGKLAYMAPEAISGKDLDARSDLFAVGVIAHELLTARPLFASKNEYETLIKVQRGEIAPPSATNDSCPPELDAIVLRALARDPDDRYASASDLRDALVALRHRLALNTSYRDIAQWLDWALANEVPSTDSVPHRVHRTPTPRPGKREEDEAVEIAWGGGGDQDGGEPILLDDVPDVSEKMGAAQLGAAPRVDASVLVGLDDDIPAPLPSHGRRSRELPIPAPPLDADEDPRSHPALSPAARIARAGDRRGADRRVGSSPPPDGVERRIGSRRATGDRRAVSASYPPSAPPSRPPTSSSPPPISTRPTQPTSPPSDRAATSDHEARPARSLTDMSTAAAAAVALEAEPADTLRTMPPMPVTKPGFAPPRNLTRAEAPNLAPELGHAERPRRPSEVTIGAAIVERQSVRRTWVLVAGLAAAGAVATAVTLYATRGSDQVASVSQARASETTARRLGGTLKFDIVPVDAEIAIHGIEPHVGSPWQIDLPAGQHSIQIQRTGYKAYLTTIELSANETSSLRVVLEPLATGSAGEDAMLVLGSTPTGLEAILDGQLLPQKTPIKMAIKPGPHTVVLRQGGVEVWRHELVARASSDYVFNPSMTVEKQRERAERAVPSEAATDDPTEPPTASASTSTVAGPTPPIDAGIAAPPPDAAAPVTPPPEPVVVKPPPPPVPVPTPAPAPRPVAPPPTAGPQVVAPNAVTRLSGTIPNLSKSKRADIPSVITAKVCIDRTGRVANVQMISKLERMTSLDLASAIKTWSYRPYQQGGTAVPVCFVVSFRVKD